MRLRVGEVFIFDDFAIGRLIALGALHGGRVAYIVGLTYVVEVAFAIEGIDDLLLLLAEKVAERLPQIHSACSRAVDDTQYRIDDECGREETEDDQ